MRLSSQILAAMVVIVMIVGGLSGEAVRLFEEKRLKEDQSNQTIQIISLLSGLTLEAIISEDIPIIETAVREAVELIPSLISIVVEDESGKSIGRWPNSLIQNAVTQIEYQKDIEFEGEIFGRMKVIWLTSGNAKIIEDNVKQARLYAIGVLALISMFFTCLFPILSSSRSLKFIKICLVSPADQKATVRHYQNMQPWNLKLCRPRWICWKKS